MILPLKNHGKYSTQVAKQRVEYLTDILRRFGYLGGISILILGTAIGVLIDNVVISLMGIFGGPFIGAMGVFLEFKEQVKNNRAIIPREGNEE